MPLLYRGSSCRRLLWLVCLLLVLGPLLPGPRSRRRRGSAVEGPGKPGGDSDARPGTVVLVAGGLTLAMAADVHHQPLVPVSYDVAADDDDISDNEILSDDDRSSTVSVLDLLASQTVASDLVYRPWTLIPLPPRNLISGLIYKLYKNCHISKIFLSSVGVNFCVGFSCGLYKSDFSS